MKEKRVLLSFLILAVLFSTLVVFAGNVIVKEGNMEIGGFGNFSGTVYINNGTDINSIGNSSWNENYANNLYSKYNFGSNNFSGNGNFQTSGGKVLIGANPASYTDFRIYKNSVNPGSGGWFGAESKVDSSATMSQANYIIAYDADISGSSVDPTITDSGYRIAVRGNGFVNTLNFKGNLANIYGFWSRTGVNLASSGSNITNAYANYAQILTHPNTTISNAYGVYISKAGSGAVTNLYDIYASDANAKNYFAGNVGIGTNNPTQKLDVRGIGNFSGTVYINNGTDISTLVGNSSFDYANVALTNQTNFFNNNQTIRNVNSIPSNVAGANLEIYSGDMPMINKGGSLGFGGYGNSTSLGLFGQIAGRKEDSTNNHTGYLSFSTSRQGVMKEQMRITSAGDVNISNNVTIGQLLKLSSISLPSCSPSVDGAIGKNSTGIYYCNSTAWKQFSFAN